jgi:hypothetical protein
MLLNHILFIWIGYFLLVIGAVMYGSRMKKPNTRSVVHTVIALIGIKNAKELKILKR